VFINAAVTQSIVEFSESQQSYHIRREHSAVLCDTQIVMKVLLCWRVWESAADSVWLLAFNALNSLVRLDHLHRQYNVSQLCDVGVTAKMLSIWKVGRICSNKALCCIVDIADCFHCNSCSCLPRFLQQQSG